jgi:hypothetical protein
MRQKLVQFIFVAAAIATIIGVILSYYKTDGTKKSGSIPSGEQLAGDTIRTNNNSINVTGNGSINTNGGDIMQSSSKGTK